MIDDEAREFTDALRRVGPEMPAAGLLGDLWRRGRRRRRARIAVSIAAVAFAVFGVAVAMPLVAGSGGLGGAKPPATSPSGPAVPSTVYPPWPWQATVPDSPRGAASILVSGTGPGLGLGSNLAVVGQDGSYRMLLGGPTAGSRAGIDTLLSPDGSHVAPAWDDLSVADLATGQIQS